MFKAEIITSLYSACLCVLATDLPNLVYCVPRKKTKTIYLPLSLSPPLPLPLSLALPNAA